MSKRFQKLTQSLASAGIDAIALNPGPTLTYLTGMSYGIMERPIVLLANTHGEAALVLPELEMLKVEKSAIPLKPFPYNDNPATWTTAFLQACRFLSLDNATIGLEPTRFRVLELRFMEEVVPNASFKSAESVVSSLRIQKDAEEVQMMRKAVEIAQNALLATKPMIKVGVSEKDIATELFFQLLRHGSDPDTAFNPIVSGGPNSANPHASPSARPLEKGDMLVIDWGACYHGYYSDLTRTFGIVDVDEEYIKIHKTVEAANAAGRAAGRPGAAAGSVDKAAREVITSAGYGPYFTHRVGHGLGLEVHEYPYMFGENNFVLDTGMVYTVEPGIYLPGRNGVRIEDDVIVTENGSESLSTLPRPFEILG